MIIGYEMFRSLTKAALNDSGEGQESKEKARWKTQAR
jgi:hypothetical protein